MVPSHTWISDKGQIIPGTDLCKNYSLFKWNSSVTECSVYYLTILLILDSGICKI